MMNRIKTKTQKKLIKFLQILLRKLGYKQHVPVYTFPIGMERFDGQEYPSLSKMRFTRRYNRYLGCEHISVLEDLKRELMSEFERNFFYYFPVCHYTHSELMEEEYIINFYYKKHHT